MTNSKILKAVEASEFLTEQVNSYPGDFHWAEIEELLTEFFGDKDFTKVDLEWVANTFNKMKDDHLSEQSLRV